MVIYFIYYFFVKIFEFTIFFSTDMDNVDEISKIPTRLNKIYH